MNATRPISDFKIEESDRDTVSDMLSSVIGKPRTIISALIANGEILIGVKLIRERINREIYIAGISFLSFFLCLSLTSEE